MAPLIFLFFYFFSFFLLSFIFFLFLSPVYSLFFLSCLFPSFLPCFYSFLFCFYSYFYFICFLTLLTTKQKQKQKMAIEATGGIVTTTHSTNITHSMRGFYKIRDYEIFLYKSTKENCNSYVARYRPNNSDDDVQFEEITFEASSDSDAFNYLIQNI